MQVFQLGALEGILLAQPPKERLLREIKEIGELEHCIKPLSSFIGWDNCTGRKEYVGPRGEKFPPP
jgi:hypothetical protein